MFPFHPFPPSQWPRTIYILSFPTNLAPVLAPISNQTIDAGRGRPLPPWPRKRRRQRRRPEVRVQPRVIAKVTEPPGAGVRGGNRSTDGRSANQIKRPQLLDSTLSFGRRKMFSSVHDA